jgi:hypothetical protein
MAKVLAEAQADQIVPRAKRTRATKQERLEARENEALAELSALGFRVTLHEMGRYRVADDLLGISAGYVPGTAYAVMYAADGRRKHVSGGSAVEALQQAQAWWRWQEGLKDDAAAKFVPSVDHEFTPAAVVQQRLSGDTATTRQRRENTERRILSFARGTAEVVDAHGEPIDVDDQTSQHREDDSEETTSR